MNTDLVVRKEFTATLSCGHTVHCVNVDPLGSYVCRYCRWESKAVASFGPVTRETMTRSEYDRRYSRPVANAFVKMPREQYGNDVGEQYGGTF